MDSKSKYCNCWSAILLTKYRLFTTVKRSAGRVKESSCGIWDSIPNKGREFDMEKTFQGLIWAEMRGRNWAGAER